MIRFGLILFFFLAISTPWCSLAQDEDAVAYPSSVPLHFDEDMDSRYKTPEFNYNREVIINDEMSVFDRLMSSFMDWLEKLLYNSNGEPTTWNTTLKIIAVLLVLWLVYLILRSFFRNEVSGIFRTNKSIPVTEVLSENIQQVNFNELVRDAVKMGNYRLAVRYYYLWWLKQLAAEEVIKWHKDKTNTAYLNEIKDTELREKFSFLSYVYEYCWYGEFELSVEQFNKTEALFKNVVK